MTIFDEKIIVQWEHLTHAMTFNEGIWCHSTRIWLFYFDDNFRRYSLWVHPLSHFPYLILYTMPQDTWLVIKCTSVIRDTLAHWWQVSLISDTPLYGVCGSCHSRRFGRRAIYVKNGNAGPKLHWRLWEKIEFSGLPSYRYVLATNYKANGHFEA